MIATSHTFLTSPWRYRQLLLSLARRDVQNRYQGSALGIAWALLNPLLLLGVYTFVFGVIFKAKWGQEVASKTEFALILFSGLMLFSFFSECINRAPSLVTSNPNYVKKVVFPLDLLSWVTLFSGLLNLLASVVIWLIASALLWRTPGLWALLGPFVLLPLLLYTLGISWFLSSLGVYLRDLNQVVGMLTMVLMFLSPVFYPISALPEEFQSLMHLNPLTALIEAWRDVMVYNRAPHWQPLLIHGCASLLCAQLGFAWFHKTKAGFADVL